MSKENNISKRTGMAAMSIGMSNKGVASVAIPLALKEDKIKGEDHNIDNRGYDGKEDLSDLKWIENRNKKELSEARIAQLLKKADKYPEQLTREETKQLAYIKQQFDGMLANQLESKDLTEEDKKKVNEYLGKVK